MLQVSTIEVMGKFSPAIMTGIRMIDLLPDRWSSIPEELYTG